MTGILLVDIILVGMILWFAFLLTVLAFNIFR